MRGGHPFRLMQILMVQMTKNLVHSFYDILYQSKGVPTPSHNFSRTWGTYFSIGHILLGTIYHALKSLLSEYEKTKDLIFYKYGFEYATVFIDHFNRTLKNNKELVPISILVPI